MQQNSYKIKLNDPCQENWQSMTDTAAGKFCNSCKKEVVDFTNFSNNQILDYFKNNGLKSGCGKFLNTQLDQITIVIDENISVHRLSYWSKFMIALLICFGGKCLNAEISFGQIIKTDTSIAKQQCDTFNTGESYEQAIKSILQSTNDTTITDTAITDTTIIDTTIQMVDTLVYEKDTLKLVSLHLDTSMTKMDLKNISIYAYPTLGFFVPFLIKKDVMTELFPTNEIISDKSILGEKQKEKSEYNNTQHVAINKNNFIEKEVPSPLPQNTNLAFEAILPNEDKKKKRNR